MRIQMAGNHSIWTNDANYSGWWIIMSFCSSSIQMQIDYPVVGRELKSYGYPHSLEIDYQ